MKNILIIILLSVISFSCSNPDVLSKSNAEDIINDCMEKEEFFNTIPISIGNDVVLTQREFKFTNALAEKGIVNYTKVKGKYNITQDKVELTEKGKKLVLKQEKERYVFDGREYTIATFKTCEYRVSEIIEIQEIPAYNTAKVKVKLKKINKTEIAFLDTNETEFLTTEITLKKTTDGWKLCD